MSALATAAAQPAEILIEPPRRWTGLGLRDLAAHRELVFFLAWREVKVRYKQTAIGVAWALLQPLATMAIFTLVFGRLARLPSDGVPYSLFALAALVPWTFFATALTQSSNSLVANAGLISKVYFPRLVIPVSAMLSGAVDLVLGLVILVSYAYARGITPGLSLLALPAFLALAMMTALGVGLWLSALNVEFRDVRHGLPFLAQLWLFCTPVIYPLSLLSEPWRTLYSLNPMVGVVEGFRWSLLGTPAPSSMVLGLSVASGAFLLVTGAVFFSRMERRFADMI